MTQKYLTDAVLDNISKDKFGHADLANEIWDIINSQETPLHIGIFGRWGVGKSTTVKFIEDRINRDNKTKFVTSNVWKYEAEGLRRKFILDISKELGIPIKEKYNEIVQGAEIIVWEKVKKYLRRIRQGLRWQNVMRAVFLALFILLSFYTYLRMLVIEMTWINAVISSVSLISIITIIITLVYSILQLIVKSSTTVTTKPFESEEQFENEFKELVKEYLQADNDAEKILIFVDDLDRCNHQKVISTLETIKTFLNIQGCVFLIACDPEVVKRAVIESNKILGFTQRDGAYYLEKFFQHVVYIPPFIPGNMREFARQMIEEAPKLSIIDDIKDTNAFDDVIFILAYEDVVNPRKMIGLINSFVTDYYIAKNREESDNSLLPETITGDVRPLAILTILKHDFPFVYDDLLKQPRLLEFIKQKQLTQITDEEIKIRYSDGNVSDQNNSNSVKSDINKLKEFIGLCELSWLSEDILPYIYLTLDKSFDEIRDVIKNPNEFDRAIRDNKATEVIATINGIESNK